MRARAFGSASRTRGLAAARRLGRRQVCHGFMFGSKKPGDTPGQAGTTRDDFDEVEMEQYFNYTGRLAVEQTYDTFNKYLKEGTHPIDVILLWAAEEGDVSKVGEVLAAGADTSVKDVNGKSPLDLTKDEEVKQMLQAAAA